MIDWIGSILQGVLLGGLYALFAAGLSLIFGIMRLVNLAHGDLIVFAAFLIIALTQALGIDSVIDEPGLQSVESDTIAPASIRRRAGA